MGVVAVSGTFFSQIGPTQSYLNIPVPVTQVPASGTAGPEEANWDNAVHNTSQRCPHPHQRPRPLHNRYIQTDNFSRWGIAVTYNRFKFSSPLAKGDPVSGISGFRHFRTAHPILWHFQLPKKTTPKKKCTSTAYCTGPLAPNKKESG